jgi:hypothetical protein
MKRKSVVARTIPSGRKSQRDVDVRQETATVNDPNIPQLREEFAYTLNERNSNVFARARLNHEARYCVWPGQSEDGRKWTPRLGEDEVFPWPGASDARVNLVDKYIRKHTGFLMLLWDKMKPKVFGTQVNDDAWASRMTNYLGWQKTQMAEARGEAELLANYLLERGTAMMGCFWDKRTQLQYQEIDLEGLAMICMQRATNPQNPDQRFADLPRMILTTQFQAEAAALMNVLFPSVPAKRLEQVVKDIRMQGYAKFPLPAVLANRPKFMALAPNDDVFIPPDCQDSTLEDTSVFWVEVMREPKFKQRAQDFNWDPEWVETMLESQRGNVEFGSLQFNQRIYLGTSTLLPRRGDLDARKLFLVVHSYRRLVDADGVPGIFYTVWNPHLTESCAQHDLLSYEHGQMPFTLFMQERRSRKPDDSRGYGEIANTWQGQIKAEWDNRIDRASISTLPPSYYPPGLQPDKWGPGVQVPTNSPQGYGFFEPAGDPAGSKEVEQSVKEYADDYFGFATEGNDPNDAQMQKQKLGGEWLAGWKRVYTQQLKLCQQFEKDEIYFRVVGSAKGQPIHATRDDLQGEFDLQVGFDIESLDPEQRKQKLEFIQMIMGQDIGGIVDHNEAMVVAFELVDPNLGERLLKPAEAASQSEVEDEMNVIVKCLAGMNIPVKPGQAYQLRLQVLQQYLQSNVAAQQAMRTNPQVMQAFENRMKGLQLQVQQQQNAVIGRGGPEFAPKMLTK